MVDYILSTLAGPAVLVRTCAVLSDRSYPSGADRLTKLFERSDDVCLILRGIEQMAAGAIRYGLTRLKRLRPYLDDGHLSIDNNAAERGMMSIAVGRKNFLFTGSDNGGRSAAIAYTLIETAKLNGVDPQAWLADVRGGLSLSYSLGLHCFI